MIKFEKSILLLKYLLENCDELMYDFNQHIQKKNIIMIFNFYIIFYLKHMIDDVLNLFSENSCEAVDKKISINDNDDLLSLSHNQMTIQCDVSDTVKSFCYSFHVSDNAVTFSHQ